jgi:hypothetical protein
MKEYMVADFRQNCDIRQNVWLGVSVENQETANERIPILLDTPAAVRFISAEPLLGEIDLTKLHYDKDSHDFYRDALLGCNYDIIQAQTHKLDWVIVGGESGKNARPMHPDWVRKIRDDCKSANVPFFFKQCGEFKSHVLKNVISSEPMPLDCFYSIKNLYRWNDGKITKMPPNASAKDFFQNGVIAFKVGKNAAGNQLDGVQHLEFPKIGGV